VLGGLRRRRNIGTDALSAISETGEGVKKAGKGRMRRDLSISGAALMIG
jgi:hypothetical protein